MNSKQSLVKPGSSEERGDHPAALMIADGFAPEVLCSLDLLLLLGQAKSKNKRCYLQHFLAKAWLMISIKQFFTYFSLMKSKKNQRLQYLMPHNGSKIEKNELSRSSFKQFLVRI